MSEELYNSNDFCKLAEEFEELKKENAELSRDKDRLMNLFMESSEYVFDTSANMKNGSHWEGCEEVHLYCRIAQLENAVRMLADKLLVSPVGYMSIQEYNELVKMVKKVLRLDDFVGDSDHEHDDRIL